MKKNNLKTKSLILTCTFVLSLALTGCSSSDNKQEADNHSSITENQNSGTQSSDNRNNTDNSNTSRASSLEVCFGDDGTPFTLHLYDNETARAFLHQLPITLDMSELNGNEKYYYLSESLPTDSSRPSHIHTGDLMLYGDNCLVLFYKNFSTSYSYTPLGRIDNSEELEDALGKRNIKITFQSK